MRTKPKQSYFKEQRATGHAHVFTGCCKENIFCLRAATIKLFFILMLAHIPRKSFPSYDREVMKEISSLNLFKDVL